MNEFLLQINSLEQFQLLIFQEVVFDLEILNNPQGDYLGQFVSPKYVHYTILLGFLSNGQKLPLFIISDKFAEVEKLGYENEQLERIIHLRQLNICFTRNGRNNGILMTGKVLPLYQEYLKTAFQWL